MVAITSKHRVLKKVHVPDCLAEYLLSDDYEPNENQKQLALNHLEFLKKQN